MRRRRRSGLLVLLAPALCAVLTTVLALAAAGCATGTPYYPRASPTGCPNGTPAPMRCPGPESLGQAVVGVSEGGRTLTVTVDCGGELTATESATQVRLRYVAAEISAGGRSCGQTPLSVRLVDPLGSRAVVDAVSGTVLVVRPAA